MSAISVPGADPLVVERCVSVVPLEQALRCLERQPQLAAPAKLALCGHGDTELFVEVSRGLDTRLALAAADAAVERARGWLAGRPPQPPAAETHTVLEDALCELGWSFEALADGAFHARLSGQATALRIEASAGDQLRASYDALLPLRGADPRTLARFALESNRRLRFARLSLLPAEADHVRAVWDAVIGIHPSAPDALREAAQAVLCARELTYPGLRALRHASVRQAFQRLRAAQG